MISNKITPQTLFSLILSNKSTLYYGQIVMLLGVLISIPIPLILPMMIDEILLHNPSVFVQNINALFGETTAFYYIFIATLGVVILRLLYYITTLITTKIFTKIAKFVSFEIRKKLLLHLRFTSMNEYESLGSGEISSNLVTDINTLDDFTITLISKFVASALTLIGVSVVLISINPTLGILILLIQPAIMLLSKKMSKRVGILKKRESEAIGNFQKELGETLELFGQIKASNQEKFFFSRTISLAKEIQNSSDLHSYKSVAYERLSYTIFLIMFEFLRAGGILLVAYSDLSIGMMFAMFGYIWFIMTPVQDLLSMQYSYSSAKTALERINNILSLSQEKSAKKELSVNAVDISIKNLSFSYAKGADILKNISLELPFKAKVALIGASGSGKTTLAQIICAFYDKKEGELLYNSNRVEELSKSSLRKKVFLVLQMPILFNSSLRFNITMGKENVSDESIYTALKIAQLESVVDAMENGLNTIVGHHGVRLSGGQRQRLSIARMIIADASVIIFDESTSALDVHTEKRIQEALEPILENKTVITIAHRLSTVKSAHTIYVLEDGEIVQEGTHSTLERTSGHYREFLAGQTS